jgi:DNA mismatch endonuclease (patch repair protein)
MALIKGKDTRPEKIVRTLLYKSGYRFRIHDRKLPGNPDIVLRKNRRIIFVHGCFWHGHRHCARASRPASNVAFWNKKLDENKERDKRFRRTLTRMGWKVLTVWECETRKPEKLLPKLRRFLGGEQKDEPQNS